MATSAGCLVHDSALKIVTSIILIMTTQTSKVCKIWPSSQKKVIGYFGGPGTAYIQSPQAAGLPSEAKRDPSCREPRQNEACLETQLHTKKQHSMGSRGCISLWACTGRTLKNSTYQSQSNASASPVAKAYIACSNWRSWP